ncbi:unnamed protein product, partial [Peniophora sp. CBMAI 1063]
QALGLEIALEDVILVTGVDRTTSWGTAVWTDAHLDAKFGLDVQYAGAGVQLAAEFSWKHTQGAMVNHGPVNHHRRPLAALNTNVARRSSTDRPLNEECNQSIFIRHIRAKRRRWLGLKLKANGQRNDEDDERVSDSDDECMPDGLVLESSPERPEFSDCLDPILDHILANCDADMVIASYEDLTLMSQPNDLASLLEVHGGYGTLRNPSACRAGAAIGPSECDCGAQNLSSFVTSNRNDDSSSQHDSGLSGSTIPDSAGHVNITRDSAGTQSSIHTRRTSLQKRNHRRAANAPYPPQPPDSSSSSGVTRRQTSSSTARRKARLVRTVQPDPGAAVCKADCDQQLHRSLALQVSHSFTAPAIPYNSPEGAYVQSPADVAIVVRDRIPAIRQPLRALNTNTWS